MSVENFLDLGYEKISRSSRITAGLKLREAAGVVTKVSPAIAGRKPSGRTGSRSASVFFCALAALRWLPSPRVSRYR